VMQSYDHEHGIDSWKTDAERGGGVLRHFLVHSMHYLEWLCGRIASVRSLLKPRHASEKTDAYAAIAFECANGVLVTVNASNAIASETRHCLTLWGDRGKLELGNTGKDPIRGFSLVAQRDGLPDLVVCEAELSRLPSELDSRVEPTARLIDALVSRLVHNGNAQIPDLGAASRAHELVEAVARSNSTHTVVYVE